MNKKVIKYIAISSILLGSSIVAISTTLALYEKWQKLDISDQIVAAGARNDEVFLSRRHDTRTDGDYGIVWRDKENEKYNIYALVYNSSMIEDSFTSISYKGISYDWVKLETVHKNHISITYPSNGTTSDLTSDEEYYYYFEFNNILYDRMQFYRISTDAVSNTTYDESTNTPGTPGTPGVPTLFEHRDKKGYGLGMADNFTHPLTKPLTNGNNVYELNCWVTPNAGDYLAYEKSSGQWLRQTLLSTATDEIVYDNPNQEFTDSLTVTINGSMNRGTSQTLIFSNNMYSYTGQFYNNDAFIMNVSDGINHYTYGYSSIKDGTKYAYYGQSGDYIKLNLSAQGTFTVKFDPSDYKIILEKN